MLIGVTINDDAFNYLRDEGYVGSLGEMLYAYWKAGEATQSVMFGSAAAAYWDNLANP